MRVIHSKFIILLLIIATIFGLGVGGGVAVSVFRAGGGRNLPIYSVEREDNKISLTFNCAWGDEDIDAILDALSKKGVLATFFIVGEWAQKYPDAVKKIYTAGHEIGMHSYDHKDYTKMSEKEILYDLKKCEEAIKNITGEPVTLVRAPSGAYNDSVTAAVEACGKVLIQWSRDSIDYKATSAQEIYTKAVEKTASGDIILMHTGTKHTAEALPRVLDSLCSRFTQVKVSELMHDKDFFVDNTGRMFLAKN